VNELAIQPRNDAGLRELALFAGAGGGILGGKLLGWRTVCAVERDAYAASVLAQRQNDGFLEPFPVWSDVCSFSGEPWRGLVDVVSGGFPCQDISGAGRGEGIDGARSGLWREMVRIVGEVRPRYVFVENSAVLTSRGLGRVLGDLAALGFDARWGVLGAGHVGAPHERERIWILADADNSWENGWSRALQMGRFTRTQEAENDGDAQGIEWPARAGVPILAHGVANRVEQLNAIGNGQVPRVAAAAWRLLSESA
jgi:DNA (cytosine-5)-methyltransferase 1